MAKNVLGAKKRVAHLKNNNFTKGECLVTTIMQEMNNKFSFPTLQKKSNEESFEKTIPIPQEDLKQNLYHRSKKFNSAKKFPLMEKTQKALKQIRHNRKIPKPRAHLAPIDDEPESIASTPIKKNEKIIKNFKQNYINSQKSSLEMNEEMKRPVSKRYKSVTENPKPNNINSQKRSLELNEERKRPVCKRYKSVAENPKPAESLKNDNLESSDGDSDYEKFVQQNKQGQKKRKTIKKLNRKQKNSKKGQSRSSSESNFCAKAKTSLDSFGNKKCKSSNKSKTLLVRNTLNKSTENSNEHDSDYSDTTSISEFACRRSMRTKNKAASSISKSLQLEQDSNKSSTSGLESSSFKRTRGEKTSNTAKSMPLEDDSAFDDESPSTSPVCRRSKRNKASYKITEEPISQVSYDSEDELDLDGDTSYTRDSSESDIENDETFTNRSVDTPLSGQNETAANKQIAIDNSCTTDTGAVTPVTDYETLVTDNLTSTENVPGIFLSNCEQHNQPDVDIPINNSTISTIKKSEDILIDLCESDFESDDTVKCTSSATLQKEESNFVAANVNNESSDELEILDVIIHENNQTKESRTSTNTSNSEIYIKTEKDISQTPLTTDIKPRIDLMNLERKNLNNEKNEAAYVTDICKDYTKVNEVNLPIHHSDILQVTGQNSTVKKEQDDDDIIIIDSENASSSSNHLPYKNNSVNCSEHLTSKDIARSDLIPVVTDKTNTLTGKELKLYEVACNNLKPKLDSFYENANDLTAFPQQGVGKEKMILNMLKSEFDTYLEILHTEKTIGATFKVMENNQAKKLLQLKSLLASNLTGGPDSSRIKQEFDLLMTRIGLNSSKLESEQKESPEVSYKDSSKEVKSSQHSCGPAQSSTHSQDLVTAHPTVVEEDVKPDITKIKAPKSPVTNNMSFGEKCIICGKDAVAACQNCARVFFCSDTCGLKYWKAGHAKECGQ